MPTRVLVADSHELFRRGLFIVLAQERDVEVVAQAEDAASAVAQAARHLPDLALVAVDLSDDLPSLCAALTAVAPRMRLLLLTDGAGRDVATPGVVGHLAKETSIDEVTAAITAAVQSHAFHPVIVERG